MTHELKITHDYFEDVRSGKKTFEVRRKDRPFAVGDRLALKEYDKDRGYSGRMLTRIIDYILDDPQYCKDGYVIMSVI